MEIKELESLQKKIETLRDKQSRAEGAIENIVASWKDTYKVSTVDEVSTLLEEKKKEELELSDLLEVQYTKLKSLTNWNLI